MAYFLFALFLFCASVAIHIYYCRRTRGSGLQAKAYILIAVFLLILYAGGSFIAGQGGLLKADSLWGLPFKITAGLVFVLLIPVYLSFYVLTQLMSPSKKILLTIARQGSLSYADILICVEEEKFIETRLDDLCSSGCVRQKDGRYVLSASGQKIAAMLNIMQHVLGRDIGG